MKTSFHRAFIWPGTAVIALGLLALNAHAAPLAAPLPVASPAVQQAAPQPAAPHGQSAPLIQAAPNQQAVPGEDILDIRGPIHIPAPFPWVAWTGGAAGAAMLGLAAWVLFRRTRRKLPWEIALEKLEATRRLMQSENAHAFSLEVSEIVRGFIEKCFAVRAAHRTTGEFLHDLVNLQDSPLAAHCGTLAEFLEHCDLAKFARWELTVPQMEAMLTSASTFVTTIGKAKAVKKQPAASAPAPAPPAEPAIANS